MPLPKQMISLDFGEQIEIAMPAKVSCLIFYLVYSNHIKTHLCTWNCVAEGN